MRVGADQMLTVVNCRLLRCVYNMVAVREE